MFPSSFVPRHTDCAWALFQLDATIDADLVSAFNLRLKLLGNAPSVHAVTPRLTRASSQAKRCPAYGCPTPSLVAIATVIHSARRVRASLTLRRGSN